jgi:hypothetical protein
MTMLTTTNIDRWYYWMLTSDLVPSIHRTPKGIVIYVLEIRK